MTERPSPFDPWRALLSAQLAMTRVVEDALRGEPRLPAEHLEAWRAIVGAQASTTRAVEEALAAAGLPPLTWHDALAPLEHAGGPMRMGELAGEVATIGRTGLSRVVDRLEREGLAERTRSEDDGRGLEVAITPAGLEVLRRMRRVYARVLAERLVPALTREQARDLAARLAPLGALPPG